MKKRIKLCVLACAALLLWMGIPTAPAESSESVVFFGDSITKRWPWGLLLPDYHVTNKGIDGDTIQDLIERIDSLIELEPDTLFLMAGINDILHQYDAELFQQDYEELLDALQSALPNTRIYVESMLPTAWDLTNELTRPLNSVIEQACQERGLAYIHLYDLFADEHGTLRRDFSLDGLHLSDEAYRYWITIIEEYL